MNKILKHLYQTGVEKMAHTLEEVSAAEFLQAVNSGEVDINDFIEPQEKVASGYDLSDLSEEELYNLLEEIESAPLEKEAGVDLNDLTVGQFIEFASTVEGELIKQAAVARLRNNY